MVDSEIKNITLSAKQPERFELRFCLDSPAAVGSRAGWARVKDAACLERHPLEGDAYAGLCKGADAYYGFGTEDDHRFEQTALFAACDNALE